jgi:hypothetical protein
MYDGAEGPSVTRRFDTLDYVSARAKQTASRAKYSAAPVRPRGGFGGPAGIIPLSGTLVYGGTELYAVPLPAALPLFGSGVMVLAGVAWRRRGEGFINRQSALFRNSLRNARADTRCRQQ